LGQSGDYGLFEQAVGEAVLGSKGLAKSSSLAFGRLRVRMTICFR